MLSHRAQLNQSLFGCLSPGSATGKFGYLSHVEPPLLLAGFMQHVVQLVQLHVHRSTMASAGIVRHPATDLRECEAPALPPHAVNPPRS